MDSESPREDAAEMTGRVLFLWSAGDGGEGEKGGKGDVREREMREI